MSELTLESLAPRRLWVGWRAEARGEGKVAKVPYNPETGKPAKADDAGTWRTRFEAEAWAKRLPRQSQGGVGIELAVIGDGQRLGGIDLDTCRDPETERLEGWAEDVIASLDSYAEVSPSDTGAKLYFSYDESVLDHLRRHVPGLNWSCGFKRAGDDHPPAIEAHLGHRYFCVTDRILDGCTRDLRNVDAGTILRLFTETGPRFADEGAARGKNGGRGEAGGADGSRSALAFRIGIEVAAAGGDFDAFCVAVEADSATNSWYEEKGAANNGRELRRIWEKVQVPDGVIRVEKGRIDLAADRAAYSDDTARVFQS